MQIKHKYCWILTNPKQHNIQERVRQNKNKSTLSFNINDKVEAKCSCYGVVKTLWDLYK